ncbi:MAG: hypothetical protein KKB31_07370 [Nanoarchaeota archaeon]|nr:hypothetical protein [Nanoarchaeota archaeon]
MAIDPEIKEKLDKQGFRPRWIITDEISERKLDGYLPIQGREKTRIDKHGNPSVSSRIERREMTLAAVPEEMARKMEKMNDDEIKERRKQLQDDITVAVDETKSALRRKGMSKREVEETISQHLNAFNIRETRR